MQRDKIVSFCEEYLHVADFQDYCHNGLQVEGAEEVLKIVSGVSLSEKLIQSAIEKKAQMLLVHHGVFMDQVGRLPQVKGILKNRLAMLLANNISLVGFHLPLDAHGEIGNNISLCKLFGLDKLEKFDVGFVGDLERSVLFADFLKMINEKLDTKSSFLNSGDEKVKRVGVISGGSSPDFETAKVLGCDTFVCGDLREYVVRGAEELKINIINAGHYNTEKLGIQNLGNMIARDFGLEHEFADVSCEI